MAETPRTTRRSDSDIISIHNIDTEDFVFSYDASAGNPPYVIPAGEVRRFPRYLANHAIKHLIDKLITKNNDGAIRNIDLRREYMEQIVVQEETYERAPVKSEAEAERDLIEEINKPSELDMLLEKRKKKAVKEEIKEEPEEKAPEEEKFEGLEKKEPKPPKPKEEPIKEEVQSVPTRAEIYKYAEETLNMVLDSKTQKKFDKMNVSELLLEVGDPRDKIL